MTQAVISVRSLSRGVDLSYYICKITEQTST